MSKVICLTPEQWKVYSGYMYEIEHCQNRPHTEDRETYLEEKRRIDILKREVDRINRETPIIDRKDFIPPSGINRIDIPKSDNPDVMWVKARVANTLSVRFDIDDKGEPKEPFHFFKDGGLPLTVSDLQAAQKSMEKFFTEGSDYTVYGKSVKGPIRDQINREIEGLSKAGQEHNAQLKDEPSGSEKSKSGILSTLVNATPADGQKSPINIKKSQNNSKEVTV
jgi:hypothetical protein